MNKWFAASTWLVMTAVLGFTGFRGGAAEPGYDELDALGIQLLEDPSFEAADPGPRREFSEIVLAPEEAKHGTQYMKLSRDKLGYIWKEVAPIPVGRVRVTWWVKGKGRTYSIVTLRRKGWRTRKEKFLLRRIGEWHPVDTDSWQKITFETELPESAVIDGVRERPGACILQTGFQGEVSIDEMSVVKLVDLQKAAVATAGAAAARPKTKAPLVTIPRLSAAPEIDGKLNEGEWEEAAAVTGFTQLDTRQLSDRQTTVYVGYDRERLYAAYYCPTRGRLGKGSAGRDVKTDHAVDAVELWVIPPGGEFRQFMGTPSGGFMDQSKSESVAWNADWTFANQIEDAGEKVGNILSFQKKIWTAELSVTFAELGVDPPAPGETWRINFTRDFSVQQGKREFKDWTTWSPIRGRFNSTEQFGRAAFSPDTPAVQFRTLGELNHGEVRLAGRADAPVRIQTRTRSPGDGKTFTFSSTTIDGGAENFELHDTVQVNKSTDLVFDATAVRSDTGQLLTAMTLPFTASPVLAAEAIPVFWKDKVFIRADASRVAGLPEEVTVQATILKGGTPTRYAITDTWRGKPYRGDLTIDIDGLPPGDYRTQVIVQGPDGNDLVSSIAPFTKPDPPEWLGNRIGVSEDVPPPWRPVKVSDRRVEMIGRVYQLSPIGLPASVTAQGEALFAAPPRLKTVVEGREVAWQGPEPKLLEATDRKAIWKIAGTAGPLSLEGTLTVEFDGFALWDVTVGSDRPVQVDALRFEFPFARVRSLYARSRQHRALLDWEGPTTTREVAETDYCLGDWPWVDEWSHEMWVGDDVRGLSVMSESDRNVQGTRRIEIDQKDWARTLKIHLIDGPYMLENELSYTYMWQGTPVRPTPADPKLWHASYRNRKLVDYLKAGKPNKIHTVLDMWALGKPSYPSLRLPPALMRNRVRYLQKKGTKVVPYFGTNLVATEVPELKPFLPAWKQYPEMMGTNPSGAWTVTCLRNPSTVDYMAWAHKGIVDDLRFDGIYLDVSGTFGCTNPYHGCGYVDGKTGERVMTHSILGNRELYKRLYTFNKSNGRDAVLFRHSMPVAAVAGFVDVVTQGEYWVRERNRQYDRLTPEVFRIMLMKNQYGTPYTWYAHHHYYRGLKWGGRVPLCAMLARCLPHHILPTVGRLGMWPVWETTDKFWTSSEFLPYWSHECPVRTPQEDIYATVYRKKESREAWLVVSNWSTEWKDVDVRIDTDKLGIGRALAVERAIQHPILQPEDVPGGDPMENTPLQYRDGMLPLRISGRNLEVVHLRGQ